MREEIIALFFDYFELILSYLWKNLSFSDETYLSNIISCKLLKINKIYIKKIKIEKNRKQLDLKIFIKTMNFWELA